MKITPYAGIWFLVFGVVAIGHGLFNGVLGERMGMGGARSGSVPLYGGDAKTLGVFVIGIGVFCLVVGTLILRSKRNDHEPWK